MMNIQQIFDKVYVHLLTQNARSADESGCLYKNPAGLKCAVGCLIPDEFYDPDIEGASTRNKLLENILIKSLGELSSEKLNLLDQLQQLHDDTPVTSWEGLLKKLAIKWNLTVPNFVRGEVNVLS